MKKIILILIISVALNSCTKEKLEPIVPPEPTVSYNINYYDLGISTSHSDSVSVFLDLDSDSVSDLLWNYKKTIAGNSASSGNYYSTVASVKSVNPNFYFSFGKALDPSSLEYTCLKTHDSISANLTWEIQNNYIYVNVPSMYTGIWVKNTNEGYIGFKFNSTQGVKYGWIKMNWIHSFTDYAINNNYNQPLAAGQKQ